MTAANWIQVGLIAATALTCAYRYRSVRRRPGDLTVRALFLALLNLTFVLLLGLPQLYWPVYRLLGEIPALPQLFQHCFSMAMTYYLELFMVGVTTGESERRVRLRRRLLLGSFVLLAVCYALGPLRLGIPILGPHGHADLGITLYVVAWQSYLCVALVDIMQMWWRRPAIARKYLRIGVTMMAIGAGLGLAQVAHKISYQVVANFGGRLPWQESGSYGIQAVLLIPVILLLTVGLTVPSLGPKAARRLARSRSYRQMGPLARAVRQACPEIMPDSRPLRFRLRYQQRVIGIRDALVGPLRPFLGVPEPGDDAAAAEARVIAEAIHRKQSGSPPATGPAPALTTGADLDADAVWLAQVSAALPQSTDSRLSNN